MRFSGREIVKRVDDVIWKEDGDAAVLVHLANGQYFRLNDVATVLWEMAEGSLTVDAIVDEVADLYELDRDKVFADAAELFGALAAESLLQVQLPEAR